MITELETLCAQVDPARPWASERADELDAVTAEAWIRAQTEDHDAQDFLGALFHTTTASPRQLSMLSAVTFIASCGGVAGLETEAEQLFVGGAAAIPQRIAQELGDRVRLGAPVSEIAWSADGALVRTAGDTLRARRVIVAMSPSDARRIVFRPGLPAKREMLHKAWFSGSAIKAVLVYDRPFWREPDGERPAIAGWSVNDAGCPSVVLDATPPDAGVGVLAAFTALLGEGERFAVAHDVLDDAEARRSRMLENVALMYGPQAAEPVDVVETHWGTEPYIGGCLGFAPPGLLTQCGDALRTPVGPVHWAGAEAADVWINHLNGAVQAGERAADEVVAALGAHDAAGATAS